MAELVPTYRTTGKRLRDRYSQQVADLHAILDEGFLCQVAYVRDGTPRLIPTFYVRVGDSLFLHGSTGSTLGLGAREGIDVAVAVTHLDALIYARSGFEHSANYRSAVVHGRGTLVVDPTEREAVLDAFVERFSPGRSALLRRPTTDELAKTAILQLSLVEASVKIGATGVEDAEGDEDAPVWAGLLPLPVTAGVHIPDNDKATLYDVPTLPFPLQ